MKILKPKKSISLLIIIAFVIVMFPFALMGNSIVEDTAYAVENDYKCTLSEYNTECIWSDVIFSYYYSGHTYVGFKNQRFINDWNRSKEFCEDLGGHLVSFSGTAEYSTLESNVFKYSNDYMSGYKIAYNIGMYSTVVSFVTTKTGEYVVNEEYRSVKNYYWSDGTFIGSNIYYLKWKQETDGYYTNWVYDVVLESSTMPGYLFDNTNMHYPYITSLDDYSATDYNAKYNVASHDWGSEVGPRGIYRGEADYFVCEFDDLVQINYFDINSDDDRCTYTNSEYFTGKPSTFNSDNISGVYHISGSSFSETEYYLANKPSTAPVRAGYTFNGWIYDVKDGIAMWKYSDSNPYGVTISNFEQYSPVNIFYADWRASEDSVSERQLYALSEFAYYNSVKGYTVSQVMNKCVEDGTAPGVDAIQPLDGETDYGVDTRDWLHATIGNYTVYEVTEGTNGFYAVLVRQKIDGGYNNYLVFRGTEPDSWTDWSTDLKLGLFGKLSLQFDQADALYQKYQKVPNLTLCGHSLGGALAEHVAILHPEAKAVTINSAGGVSIPLTLAKGYKKIDFSGIELYNNIRAGVNENDILNNYYYNDVFFLTALRDKRSHTLYESTSALAIKSHSTSSVIIYDGYGFNTTERIDVKINRLWEYKPGLLNNIVPISSEKYYLGTSGSDNIAPFVLDGNNKLILCGDGNDTVNVMLGENIIVTGGGDNYVSGGLRSDEYVYSGGHLRIDDPSGKDTLIINSDTVTVTDIDANQSGYYIFYTTGGIIEINKSRGYTAEFSIADSLGPVAYIAGGILNSYLVTR